MIDKQNIFNWLKEFGANPEEDKAKGAEWVVQGSFLEMHFAVLQPSGGDYIQLQRGMSGSDEHTEKLKGMEDGDYQAFLYRLKRGLLLCHIRYQLKFEGNILVQVLLSDRIYEDGLSKEIFFDKLYKLHDSSILLIVELKYL